MNNTLHRLAVALLFLCHLTAAGQQAPADNNKSLLWSISGHQLKKTSYLFGTIHLICRDDYFWTAKMKESLEQSEKVCFELDLGDPAIMSRAAAGLTDTSGKTLKDYFTPEQYTLIQRYLKDTMGMDISIFQNLKPLALLSAFASGGVSCPDPTSYEDSILTAAQAQNKGIMGLETPEEPLEALEKLPADSIVSQLMDEVQGTHNDDSEFSQLVAAYKQQDLPLLYQLINSSESQAEEMGVLLQDRNKKWLPRMCDKMRESSVFFAVGAGHLWGEEGVISLLRKSGYTVRPLH